MDRRRFLHGAAGIAGTFAAGGLLAGCGDDDGGSGSGDASAEGASSGGPGTITTSYQVSAWPSAIGCVPHAIALDSGLFENHGWTVTEVVSSPPGGTAFRNMAAGDLPIAEMAWPAALLAANTGADVKIITGCVNSLNDGLWLRRKDDSIASPEDLVGKRFGISSRGGASESAAMLILDALGLADQVEITPAGGLVEGFTLLESGELDVAFSLNQLLPLAEDRFDIAFRAGDYLDNVAISCLVVGTDFLEENSDLVGGFLEARAEGVRAALDDAAAAAATWSTLAEIDEAVCQETIEVFNAESPGWLEIQVDGDSLGAIINAMQLQGQLGTDDDFPYLDFLDQRFVPQDLRIS